MTANTTISMVLVAVVLLGGIAAGGAVASPVELPDQAADEAGDRMPTDLAADDRPAANHSNVSSENTSNATPQSGADAANQSASDDRPGDVGPPSELPEQAADHVTEIHATIESFLSGSIDHLGEVLGDLLGSDGNDQSDETE